ncbi:hypothetical protein [Wenzhouxiangella marina]|uniref:Uncharacterized protein n=1 Tax=Wenzhouxiangella marina TaxID=1579979 RepID=A0A0K0XXY9_9GAMM|nr:hypothetical protein [Wenzhouxiangella marina]AKS42548.1 hypothetical protein WM2015_2185 [Wenzhouxiangella marina]MBB6085672.1 hypothetical protein [Wenzhouxiangella marina]
MTPEQRFDILKLEITLIQRTLDKYDLLIFRGRTSFITLWMAGLGLAFTIKSVTVPLLVVVLSLAYWFLEGTMRYQYWFKYVDRYRFLRDRMNSPDPDLDRISIYDLTNLYHRKPVQRLKKFKACFLKKEPSVLYGLMGGLAFLLWLLLQSNVLQFPVDG